METLPAKRYQVQAEPNLRTRLVALLVALVACSTSGFSQTEAAPSQRAAASLDPQELVRKATLNELKANETPADEHFMFRGVKTTPKGSVTKLYAETKQGSAGLAIAYDGKPLTPDQQRDEQARLQRFMNNQDELRKKQRQERDDAERTTRIMRALPDAFIYQYAGEEPGTQGIGRVGDPLVKLTFRPNLRYQPPSRVEEVLTGMQGHILVDAVHYRIASIDGTLFRPVGFGWGILGHLNAGGHFVVHQEDVNNVWEISSMTVNFTGKILLFKNLNIDSTEVYSNFKRVPEDLTFAQAVEHLKKEQATLAENGSSEKLAESQKHR
ncbi:MAG: hypothetical protein ACRD3Q_10780 [Terriglobales bacterium]